MNLILMLTLAVVAVGASVPAALPLAAAWRAVACVLGELGVRGVRDEVPWGAPPRSLSGPATATQSCEGQLCH